MVERELARCRLQRDHGGCVGSERGAAAEEIDVIAFDRWCAWRAGAQCSPRRETPSLGNLGEQPLRLVIEWYRCDVERDIPVPADGDAAGDGDVVFADREIAGDLGDVCKWFLIAHRCGLFQVLDRSCDLVALFCSLVEAVAWRLGREALDET